MEIFKHEAGAPIPLCEPNLNGNEKMYTSQAIDSNWLSGGHFLNLFEKKLAEFTGSKHAVGMSSGTTALQISLILAGVEANDLVVVPNLTFVATANAVKYLKADPVLMDVDRNAWVLDLQLLRNFLENETYRKGTNCYRNHDNRRIKAVITVHLLGNMCDMQALLDLGSEYHLQIIEDAACSLGSFQQGRHSGTFGLTGTLSFNSNKIITTGGGGAILTNSDELAKKARSLIAQAKSPGIEYHHNDLGFNYRLVNPLAAIGVAQMEQLDHFITMKETISSAYFQNLHLSDSQIQKISPFTKSNYWHFIFLTDKSRELITYLAGRNIETRPAWLPVNHLPLFKNDAYIQVDDHSGHISDRGIMLPCSTSITESEINVVCESIEAFYNHKQF